MCHILVKNPYRKYVELFAFHVHSFPLGLIVNAKQRECIVEYRLNIG